MERGASAGYLLVHFVEDPYGYGERIYFSLSEGDDPTRWRWGRMHEGFDIAAPTGQTIVAATDGHVVHAGWINGYGQTVMINHGGGIVTLYAHMSAFAVSEGQLVSHGQKVGGIGSTGNSTGPHLHFEVRVNGEPRDPMNWYR
jgi:murein DD-endopeptidase MepM/ murein hydrolase activator NlpD